MIGDGGLSAGMAFGALNHAGALDLDLLVVLNDNDMSISQPVGRSATSWPGCCRAVSTTACARVANTC